MSLSSIYPFLKYISFGSLSAGTHFAILVFCVEILHINATLSTTIGFIIATVLNYLLQRQWTFKSSMAHNRAFSRYCLVTSLTMCLNILLFWTLTIPFGLWYVYSQLLVTILIATLNFFINRHFTFKDEFIMSHFRESYIFTGNPGISVSLQCLILVVVSSLVRLTYLSMTQAVTGDAVHYATIAGLIINGEVPDMQSAWMNLFCHWQSLFLYMGFAPVTAAITSSFIPGVLLVCPVVIMSRSLYSERVAWIAALFTAFHPRLVEYSCNGHSEMFYLFFFTVGINLWTLSYLKERASFLLFGAGLCFGIYMGVRKEAVIPFFACLTLDGALGPRKQFLQHTLSALGGLFLVELLTAGSLHLPSVVFPSVEELGHNVGLMFEKLPRVLLSPIFLFAICLPFFSSRKHLRTGSERPLLVMLLFPLIYYPFVQVLPRFLLPILIPIHIFGAAGIKTLSTYVTTEVLRKKEIYTRYLVTPILIVFFVISLFLGQLVEERRQFQHSLNNDGRFALLSFFSSIESKEICYRKNQSALRSMLLQ